LRYNRELRDMQEIYEGEGTLVQKVLDGRWPDVRSICHAATSKRRCPREGEKGSSLLLTES
jgi:hypothetical protein